VTTELYVHTHAFVQQGSVSLLAVAVALDGFEERLAEARFDFVEQQLPEALQGHFTQSLLAVSLHVETIEVAEEIVHPFAHHTVLLPTTNHFADQVRTRLAHHLRQNALHSTCKCQQATAHE
jgi:hypothetical protein